MFSILDTIYFISITYETFAVVAPGSAAVTNRSQRRFRVGGTALAWISKRRHNTRRAGSKFARARPNSLQSGVVTR